MINDKTRKVAYIGSDSQLVAPVPVTGVAHICGCAGDVDGNVSVTVDVTTTAARGGAADGVADRVRTSVEHALRALESPPRIKVRTTASKGDDQ